jgi:hypothetical protein
MHSIKATEALAWKSLAMPDRILFAGFYKKPSGVTAMFLKTTKPRTCPVRILSIFLCFLAVIATGVVSAEEISHLKETSTKGIRANPIAATQDPCSNPLAHCDELLQASRLEESRALAMAETAMEARSISEKAKRSAVFYEDLARQKTVDAKQSYTQTSRSVKPSSKLLWRSADILLRLLVPRHVRKDYWSKGLPDQSSVSHHPANVFPPQEEDAAKARNQGDKAWVAAETAIEKAEAAENAAEKARAAADKARFSHEGCVEEQG